MAGQVETETIGWDEPVRWNRVLFASKIAHNLFSMSDLCDDDQAVLFMKTDGTVEKKNIVVGVDERTDRMYPSELQQEKEEALSAPENEESMLGPPVFCNMVIHVHWWMWQCVLQSTALFK